MVVCIKKYLYIDVTNCPFYLSFVGWRDSVCGLDASKRPGHGKNTKYMKLFYV